jgi:protein arginine N-methyltransferase 5
MQVMSHAYLLLWNAGDSAIFSHFCSKLAVALRLTADLPDDCVIDTWFAEPVRLLVIPADIFLTNRNAYPVLSRRHQSVVRKFFQLPGMRVLLTGRPHHRLDWEP